MAATFKFPRIYPITDRLLSGISHIEQVRKLTLGGAEIIQLRDKSATSFSFYEAAREVVRVSRESGVRIIINDRVDIAKAVQAHGVHLGQEDLPADRARELLGNDAIIGLSTHSVQQAVEAMAMPVDYIAVGPIFATSTKARPDPVIGLDGLRAVRAAIGTKQLVAIGGIDIGNFRDVLSAGADSAAVIGAIIGDPSKIEERTRLFNTLSR